MILLHRGGKVLSLNVICETTGFLWLMYFVNLFRKLIFIFLPIVLIFVTIVNIYHALINKEIEYRDILNTFGKKIIAIVIIFFIPIFVDLVMSLTSYKVKDSYKSCLSNGTIEKINYYSGVEAKVNDVKELINNVRNIPTVENLERAENALEGLYGVANGSIIEDLEYSLASIRTKVTTTNSDLNCLLMGGQIENDTCVFTTNNRNNMQIEKFNDNDYYIINTKENIKTYYEYIQKNRIGQDQGSMVYYDQCLCFCEEHAYSLMNGNTHKPAAAIAHFYYSGFVKAYDNDDKSKILNIVYSELTNNKPVILMVNGNRDGTSRHYVTVIGYRSTVTSAANLQDTDLLFIDSYDAKIKKLNAFGTSRFMTTGAKCHKDYSGYQVYTLI